MDSDNTYMTSVQSKTYHIVEFFMGLHFTDLVDFEKDTVHQTRRTPTSLSKLGNNINDRLDIIGGKHSKD